MKNFVNLTGRVGTINDTKVFENGNKVTSFSLATSERYKDKSGQKVENTEWHNCVVYNKTADIFNNFVKKGDLIDIQGKIKTRSWENKEGQKQYATEIIVNELIMLGSKGNSQSNEPKGNQQDEPVSVNQNDDLPF